MNKAGRTWKECFAELNKQVSAQAQSRIYYERQVEPTTIEARHAAGVKLNQFARLYMRLKSLSYSEALQAAILGNPILGEQYVGKPVPDYSKQVERYLASDTDSRGYGDSAPNIVIARIVTGVPRLADNSIDIGRATRAVNEQADSTTIRQAASDCIDVLARDWIIQNGVVRSETPEVRNEVRRKVRSEHPALAKVEDGGPMTPQALRELLPQLFR